MIAWNRCSRITGAVVLFAALSVSATACGELTDAECDQARAAHEAFASRLRAVGLHTTVRRNRGIDIGAACGQLAAEKAGAPAPAAVQRRRDIIEQRSAAALGSGAGGRMNGADGPMTSARGSA